MRQRKQLPRLGKRLQKALPIELYLVDKDGFVVPHTLTIPKTNSVAKESLEYLVKDGPLTEMLPNGFQRLLPAGTEVTLNIKVKVATVDFWKDFNDDDASAESQIMQSGTWTLTQFDSTCFG
ncbi:GerMN domain-containing protein [Niallia taxi]|nr:GerMN domain-containing protein [Niallia taxi]MDE5052283.1 GerMN domain-containing protein [Niallia taxi]